LRIIGGTAVSEEERLQNFPWIAMLGGSLPRCGGAIISEWYDKNLHAQTATAMLYEERKIDGGEVA